MGARQIQTYAACRGTTGNYELLTAQFFLAVVLVQGSSDRGARNTGDATTISKSTTGDHYAFLYN